MKRIIQTVLFALTASNPVSENLEAQPFSGE